MTTRVTITKAGRRDSYGIELVVGQTITVDDQFALDLVRQGFATDTDNVMGFNPSSFVNHSYSPNSPKPNQPLSEELSGMARVLNGDLVDGAGNVIQNGQGLRTVLYGDSETDWYQYPFVPSSISFNTTTRELTIGVASAHGLWVGLDCALWNYSYASMRNNFVVPITALVSTTSFKVVLPAGFTDLPNGALAGSTFFRTAAVRGSSNWVNMAQMQLGWPLNIVHNGGQSGEWTTGALTRVQADCISKQPQVVIMNCLGINDQTYGGIDSTGGFNSDVTTIANNRAIFDTILATGAYLIVGTIMPAATGESRANIDIMDRVIRINNDLWDYAQGKTRMRVVDLYGSMIDPANATGLAFANLMRNDAIHLGIRGAIRAGALLATAIQSITSAARSTLPQSLIASHTTGAKTVTSATASGGVVAVVMADTNRWRAGEEIRVTGMGNANANGVFSIDSVVNTTTFTYSAPGTPDGVISGTKVISRSRNIWRNNLLATTTGGSSSVGAGALTATKIAALLRIEVQVVTTAWVGTADVVADDSGFGNKQTLAITAVTADGSSGGSARTQFTVAGTTSFATEMQGNGRSYNFECTFRAKSTAWANTPVSDLYSQFQVVGSDGNTYTANGLFGWDGAETSSLVANIEWHINTPPITIPVGVTVSSANFIVWARHGGVISGGATLTFELARPAVYDVTGNLPTA